jgi:hypothetical protein
VALARQRRRNVRKRHGEAPQRGRPCGEVLVALHERPGDDAGRDFDAGRRGIACDGQLPLTIGPATMAVDTTMPDGVSVGFMLCSRCWSNRIPVAEV